MKKDIFESAEVFETYARIDFRYLCLRKVYDSMATNPMDILIDEACGKVNQDVKNIIELMEGIIADKMSINADTTQDKILLGKVKCSKLG